jgi:hypothetical protein
MPVPPALPMPPAPEDVVVLAPPDPTVVVVTVVPTVDVELEPMVTLDVVDEPVVMPPVEVVEAAVVLDDVLEPAVERPPSSSPGRTPSIMRPPHSKDAASVARMSGLPKALFFILFTLRALLMGCKDGAKAPSFSPAVPIPCPAGSVPRTPCFVLPKARGRAWKSI